MMYELMLGQMDTTKFGNVGYPIVYISFMFASMLLIVVMLNLLIAIQGESFSVV